MLDSCDVSIFYWVKLTIHDINIWIVLTRMPCQKDGTISY